MANKVKVNMMDKAKELRMELANLMPKLDTERLKFLLESYEETECEPAVIRRAKLNEKTLNEKTLYIDENPIVGTVTQYRSGLSPYPEWACKWMRKETKARFQLGELDMAKDLTDEDRDLINRAVDYWENRTVVYRTRKMYQEVTGVDAVKQFYIPGVALQGGPQFPLGFIILDYGKVLNKGIKGIIADVKEQMAKLSVGELESVTKRHFYNAELICLNAVVNWAHRYAALAREMAAKESDPERKKELKNIAKICDWVPENPVRNFREAVQSYWFAHCAAYIETCTWAMPPARFPQYMYPFYKKDKEAGKITEQEAKDLLAMLFVKYQEIQVHNSERSFKGNSGQMAIHISLGGVDENGDDATNDIDYMLLDVQREMKCAQPSLSVLYHDKMSEEFLLKCIETIKTGIGQPQFQNCDNMVQKLFLYHDGMTLKDARGGANLGCVMVQPLGCANLWEGIFNLAKMVELTLNNGKDPKTGVQVGPQTGEAESFSTYEKLWEAVKIQILYCTQIMRDYERLGVSIMAEIAPLPFQSALIPGCIEKGMDVMVGGSKYGGLGSLMITGVDLGNSLAAVKKLVFDDKRITMKELKDALAANFEGNGYDNILKMCLDAPKYGNDDPYVDHIVRDVYAAAGDAHEKTGLDYLGRKTRPEAVSASTHNTFGYATGALPSGRKAGVALADASVSSMPGTDMNGPTALIKSAAQAIDIMKYGTNHFNMKFHPSAMEGREGGRKLLSLIKTYMDLGGFHVQFNCVSSDTLKKAQQHPADFRDLVVRVAGFSAFFVNLDKGVQDEIIKRSELKFEQ
ncbi:MAG: pyruvate formate lyase family protein [Syntrophales bacterium]